MSTEGFILPQHAASGGAGVAHQTPPAIVGKRPEQTATKPPAAVKLIAESKPRVSPMRQAADKLREASLAVTSPVARMPATDVAVAFDELLELLPKDEEGRQVFRPAVKAVGKAMGSLVNAVNAIEDDNKCTKTRVSVLEVKLAESEIRLARARLRAITDEVEYSAVVSEMKAKNLLLPRLLASCTFDSRQVRQLCLTDAAKDLAYVMWCGNERADEEALNSAEASFKLFRTQENKLAHAVLAADVTMGHLLCYNKRASAGDNKQQEFGWEAISALQVARIIRERRGVKYLPATNGEEEITAASMGLKQDDLLTRDELEGYNKLHRTRHVGCSCSDAEMPKDLPAASSAK